MIKYRSLLLVVFVLLLSAPAQAGPRSLTTLHAFHGLADGGGPQGALVLASDGNFYGTSSSGGGYGDGTVFKMTPSGVLSTLYSFTGMADGDAPECALTIGTDGNFYGTAPYAGSSNFSLNGGAIFKITPSGQLTVLFSFADAGAIYGAYPVAGLILGSDGNFYGTTEGGGAAIYGTAFKITPSGQLTTLHSFSGPDGATPEAALVQGSDGSFYGTTSTGGTAGKGTIFKVTSDGTFTSLYSFSGGSDGANPTASLIQGSDGNFYGATDYGGTNNYGTLFKITPGGTLTSLHRFTGSDGSVPYGALVQGRDGAYYGTVAYGGNSPASNSNYSGAIFKLTSSGTLTILYSFNGYTDGARPLAPLIQTSDGSFYGTNFIGYDGGPTLFGTTFRFSP